MPATSPTSAATWTNERIELLKSHFHAGLSCREIAADIGVSRNAVIGKLSRLNLTRGPKREERSLEKSTARALRTLRRLQYEMLGAIFDEAEMPSAHAPIDETNRCSLLELSENRCRWPISTPGADDFCFCGNASPDGQSYCTGHARLAYRPSGRARIMRG